MNQTMSIALVSILLAACAASDEGGDDAGDAEAAIEALDGSEIAGEGDFGPEGDGVLAEIEVENAVPGDYRVEIHEHGDCGDGGLASGALWSSDGDLGVLTVTSDGLGVVELMSTAWTLGDGAATDVIGRSVVILAGAAPIACGVVAPDVD